MEVDDTGSLEPYKQVAFHFHMMESGEYLSSPRISSPSGQ